MSNGNEPLEANIPGKEQSYYENNQAVPIEYGQSCGGKEEDRQKPTDNGRKDLPSLEEEHPRRRRRINRNEDVCVRSMKEVTPTNDCDFSGTCGGRR